MPRELTQELLLEAYAQGFFPMGRTRDDPQLYWFSPDPRAVLPLETFHLSRRLKKTLRRESFRVTVDMAFMEVMAACAAPRASDPEAESWINEPILALYGELWRQGHAHSV
jgi:leucyl/phenylalanyl-tRNA--protein transferase